MMNCSYSIDIRRRRRGLAVACWTRDRSAHLAYHKTSIIIINTRRWHPAVDESLLKPVGYQLMIYFWCYYIILLVAVFVFRTLFILNNQLLLVSRTSSSHLFCRQVSPEDKQKPIGSIYPETHLNDSASCSTGSDQDQNTNADDNKLVNVLTAKMVDNGAV